MARLLAVVFLLGVFATGARAEGALSDTERKDIETVVAAVQAKAPKMTELRTAMTSITRNDDAAAVDAAATRLKAEYADLTGQIRAVYEKIRGCSTRIEVTIPDGRWVKAYRSGTQSELNALERLIRENHEQETASAARETGMKKDIYQARAQAIEAILINTFLPTKNDLLGGLDAFTDAVDSVYSGIEVCRLKYAPLFAEVKPPSLFERFHADAGSDGKSLLTPGPEPARGSFGEALHAAGYFALNNVLKNAVLISLVAWSWRNPPVGLATTTALGLYWFYF